MKRIMLLTAITALFTLALTKNYAQEEWAQGKTGIYSVGIGGTNAIGLGTRGYTFLPSGMSLNISGEYKVYKFIGVGFQTGVDFFIHRYYDYGLYPGVPYYGVGGSYIGIPLAVKANIHILDAIGGIAIANKLDVYGGLNLGAGVAFGIYTAAPVVGFLQVGPQVGVRYWFGKVAIFGEFGWGATFANIGVSF